MNAFSLAALALGLAALPAVAQEHAHAGHAHHGNHAHHATHTGQQGAAVLDLAEGEVRKIDKEAGKITLRHGEIKNLGMPGMTMVLRVRDAAMLDTVKVGDQVRFAAERIGGAVTIVELQPALGAKPAH